MTDSLFRLDPLLPVWVIALLFLSGMAILIFLEIKKRNRFRNLRLCCVTLLMLSIAGILIQPKIKTQKSDLAILLTERSDKEIVDSLKEQFPGAQILVLGNYQSHPSAKAIASAHEIPEEKLRIVVGDGLSRATADVIGHSKFTFLNAPPPKGIISLNLPTDVKTSRKSAITGVYNNSEDSVKIVLEGPGGKEDSVTIAGNGSRPFRLSFIPREKGNFSYSLSIDGQKEVIPIKAESENQMKILIVQMFPTFETGYLKNLLARDHKLAFRYQLSKNNFRYEYINHQPVRVDRLSNEILNDFDLVILDSDALALFSPAERKNLESSVSKGLGVLLLLNEQPKSNRAIQSLLPVTFRPFAKDTASFVLTRRLSLPVWPVEAVDNGQIIPIIQNNNRILAGYVFKGFGKIGFQLFQETYKLTLEGDSASYKNLWTTILQKNARTVTNNFQIRIKNDFPVFANEPVTVEVIGSSENAPVLLHDGVEIPMVEDFVIDDLWTTKVWSDNSGWHELQIKGDSTKHSYFVSKKGEWKSLAAANSIRNTQAIASTEPVDAISSWEYKPFAPWLFYFLFLMSAAVLWLVPKI